MSTESNRSATIHLGASSVSLMIIEDIKGERQPVEFLEQPVPLARDIFSKGQVSSATIRRCTEILQSYILTLKDYGIQTSDIRRTIVTNILSEATNCDTLLYRIHIATKLTPELLDDGEMTRLIFLKTRRRRLDTPTLKKKNTLVLHVGPGNTRALLFKKGRIVRYTSYRLGTHRTREAVDSTGLTGPGFIQLIRDHISGQTSQIAYDYENDEIENILVIGFEIQHLASKLTLKKSSESPLTKLRKLITETSLLSDEECVKRYQLDYHTTEALLPALEINLAIAEHFDLDHIQIPDSDYERGLLLDFLISDNLATEIQEQVMRHAKILGKRYQSDPNHAKHVSFLCDRLYTELQDIHQLSPYDALLLRVAAYLHEVGGYISPRSHHKHSQYLILNSEIFGLRSTDVNIIAQIARYHRKSPPKLSHQPYRLLSPEDRIRVSKMAAILRVADALERTHSSRILDLTCSLKNNRLTLTLQGIQDATVERLAISKKGQLFTSLFGLEIILKEA